MKIGIYISGLAQSFGGDSVEKYAERLKDEMSFNTTGINYEVKIEKISYRKTQESTVVNIVEATEEQKCLYKIYEFKYKEILTEKFISYPIIVKNLLLFVLVIQKLPLLITRLFKPASYNRPLQTLYVFLIFFIIASAIIFMIPATLGVITNFFENPKVVELIGETNQELLQNIAKTMVSVAAVLLLVIPQANVLITNLATEFVCANNYMQHGAQRQLILGNLDHLVEFISENEKDCKIHFHAYSFGSVVAIDYLYPYGLTPSKNAELYCEAIITIGTPVEFIKSYYPNFYQNRKGGLWEKIHWLNIYSIADALATNFRKDAKAGDAEFGIEGVSQIPVNINYEVAPLNNKGIIDFIMLYSIKVHSMYWDQKPEGQSCLKLIYKEMNQKELV